MSERDFQDQVDAVFQDIEMRIEDANPDIDIEATGGILTLTLPNDSKIIINRQSATQEIWVAARSGGYHLRWQDAQWHCNVTNERLANLLQRVLAEQDGGDISF